jgi:hypothetical protein
MVGWNRENAAAALLLQGGIESVATVLVNGEIRKRDGRLSGAERACDLLGKASDHLYSEVQRLGGSRGLLEKGLAAVSALGRPRPH